MILTFPDLDTVRLALTSGAVPGSVALARAAAAFGADGRVWIETSAEVPRKSLAELRRLGAGPARSSARAPRVEVACWLQLLPLGPSAEPVARPEQTPILFELADSEQLSALVNEVLRLGNDRQAYRWLDDAQGKSPGRALLRVVGPPYYSLLRAIDRDGKASTPIAYVEQAPRVWVQLGYQHALGEQIKAPAGQVILLRPPRRWTVLPDGLFHDIYEVLEFALPGQDTRWKEADLGQRLTVPLRLAPGGADDTAELWVLREKAVEQLDQLVREADDMLLAQLAFGVGAREGERIIVLRARPSRQPLPALELNAVAYRQHQQRVPNLFIPIGTRLSPPLRRDAVRRTLADDPALVTWLAPTAEGAFRPESLPDSAFRPLADWVDYVLGHDHEPLEAWMESARFEFESFVCEEDERPTRPRKPAREPRGKAVRSPLPGPDAEPPAAATQGDPDETAAEPLPESPASVIVAAPANELREQLDSLEQRFLAVEGALDAPARRELWPQMAALNARLGSADDAGVCWMNALWVDDDARAARALHWFRAEAQAVPLRQEAGWPQGRTWASAAALAPRGAAIESTFLDLLVKLQQPSPADVRALAAHVFWAACQKHPPESIVQRLPEVGRFLEEHEDQIPARAAWLAALGLHRLAGGDALGLARARDRLLERLFQAGLRPERDLPSFLRFSGPVGNQRYRAVRQWLAALCDRARHWVDEKGQIYPTSGQGEPRTSAYIDLMFAFGLAKLGETDACLRLRERATSELVGEGEAHEFLLQAFHYRIRRALEGQPHAGPLPAEQTEYLAELIRQRKENKETAGTGPVYVIDRLRALSRILEPDQKVEPYRHTKPFGNELARALGELPDIPDRGQVADRVRILLNKVPRNKDGPEPRARILRAALDQAPRVGEDFSLEMLAETPSALDALPPPAGAVEFAEQADLLEKALFVAAHFDCKDYVEQLVARFSRLLETQRDTPTVQALDSLAAQSFRGLRKLGMQQEIRDLLQLLKDVLLRGRDLSAVEDPEWRARQPAAFRALLPVAASWYYFGEQALADTVLQAARHALLAPLPTGADGRPTLSGREVLERTALARAYAIALGQAPVEFAQEHFEELFEKLEGILDTFTTNDHYSQCQLQVVEAAVLAVVSDDFTLGATVRRWLDEDEYLVRRRIHQDVKALVAH